ncbi:hypothetical protein, partial [Methylacidiphilum caldifontis]|uniref:hypothetical protein n=1 Tax=Methylacidiphilum caldifontis TaxID=2795386 RepID=UPI001ABC4830
TLGTFQTFAETLFGDWELPERYIRQFTALSIELEALPPNQQQAVRHHQWDLVRALRLLVELNVSPNVWDGVLLTPEQMLVRDILRRIQEGSPVSEDLADAFTLTMGSIEDAIKRALNTSRNQTESVPFINSNPVIDRAIVRKRLVVHGIHQFQPLQLRAIRELENACYTIIFLHNYQPLYPTVYGTWDELYSLFGVNPVHDRLNYRYFPES